MFLTFSSFSVMLNMIAYKTGICDLISEIRKSRRRKQTLSHLYSIWKMHRMKQIFFYWRFLNTFMLSSLYMLYQFIKSFEEMLNSIISFENKMAKEPACLSSKQNISHWMMSINFRRCMEQHWECDFRKTTSCLLKC